MICYIERWESVAPATNNKQQQLLIQTNKQMKNDSFFGNIKSIPAYGEINTQKKGFLLLLFLSRLKRTMRIIPHQYIGRRLVDVTYDV